MSFFSYGFEKRAKEHVVGGKADGKPDSEYPQDQLKKGRKVEREHTKDPEVANEIAKDHLEEDKEKGIKPPNYYDRLEKVEKKAFVVGFEKGAFFGFGDKPYPEHEEEGMNYALDDVEAIHPLPSYFKKSLSVSWAKARGQKHSSSDHAFYHGYNHFSDEFNKFLKTPEGDKWNAEQAAKHNKVTRGH